MSLINSTACYAAIHMPAPSHFHIRITCQVKTFAIIQAEMTLQLCQPQMVHLYLRQHKCT